MDGALEQDIERVSSTLSSSEELAVNLLLPDGAIVQLWTQPSAVLYVTIVNKLEAASMLPRKWHSLEIVFGGTVLEDDGTSFELQGVDDEARLHVSWESQQGIEMSYFPDTSQRSENMGDVRYHKTSASLGGATLVSAEPLGSAYSGMVAFEVEVEYQGQGHEGIELGVSTLSDIQNKGYAVLFDREAWVSSDAGRLWVGGNSCRDAEMWRTTCPNQLQSKDVVQLVMTPCGEIVISVNDQEQARWNLHKLTGRFGSGSKDLFKPLYAVVGMRKPCWACMVRTCEQ